MRGGGVWNFSENSSVLDGVGFPYSEMSSYVPNSVLVALYVYFPFDTHKYVIFDIFDPILLKYMGLLSI